MVVNTIPTVEEIRARLAAENPMLADDTLDDQAARRWRLAWHNAQVDRLCELSTDPDRARSLVRWIDDGQSLRGQLAQFKAILIGNSLLTIEQARAFADEPDAAKMHYPATANKMIVPSESNK